MSTHSAIIMKTKTGYKGIYCHFDGYPSGVGRVLQEHYTDPKKVAALINLGFISSLGEEVTPDPTKDHNFDLPQPGVTVAYKRDRGEFGRNILPQSGSTPGIVARMIDHEYAYVFDGTKWGQL